MCFCTDTRQSIWCYLQSPNHSGKSGSSCPVCVSETLPFNRIFPAHTPLFFVCVCVCVCVSSRYCNCFPNFSSYYNKELLHWGWRVFQGAGWPTPNNWTEASAREHCERELEKVTQLRYCDKAVLTANGTYSYADIINMCVEDIRVCVLPLCVGT